MTLPGKRLYRVYRLKQGFLKGYKGQKSQEAFMPMAVKNPFGDGNDLPKPPPPPESAG